jgi:hypothetical protein
MWIESPESVGHRAPLLGILAHFSRPTKDRFQGPHEKDRVLATQQAVIAALKAQFDALAKAIAKKLDD